MGKCGGENVPEKRKEGMKEGRSGEGRGGGGFVKRSPCPLSASRLGISNSEIEEVVSLPLLCFPFPRALRPPDNYYPGINADNELYSSNLIWGN